MVTDKKIELMVKAFLAETREKKTDGTRGNFQEIRGFVFFIDVKNSTEAFLVQQDRTYLKFMHTFYAGVFRIFKAYKFQEDSVKFLGDGILGVYSEYNTAQTKCPFRDISEAVVKLVKEIIKNLGTSDNEIIEGIRISIVPTDSYKLYRGKTGAYGDSRIEYNGLAINQAINLTKIKRDDEPFASMRIKNWRYPDGIDLGNGVFEHGII